MGKREELQEKERVTEADAPVPKENNSTEKFWRLTFQAKTHPNDTEDVMLFCNGESLVVERDVEVVIPDRFKESADHAVYKTWSQLPGENRKRTGQVKVYPYSGATPATREEFLEQVRAGNKTTKETLIREGAI